MISRRLAMIVAVIALLTLGACRVSSSVDGRTRQVRERMK